MLRQIKNYACLGGIVVGGVVFLAAGAVVIYAVNAMAICFTALSDDGVSTGGTDVDYPG